MNFPGWRISIVGPDWRPAQTHAPLTMTAAKNRRKTRNFRNARIILIIARRTVVYMCAILVRYFRVPRGSMVKKLLVDVAFIAIFSLVPIIEQSPLG